MSVFRLYGSLSSCGGTLFDVHSSDMRRNTAFCSCRMSASERFLAGMGPASGSARAKSE